MNKDKMLVFPEYGGESGKLTIMEGGSNVPFEIKRVFYIYCTDQHTVRGQHANRESEFVLISISGSCKIRVVNGTGEENVYCLDHPNMGLYLPKMTWKDMYDFSTDSILLALASTHYDPDEYIRDYEEYLREIGNDPKE